MLRLPLRVFALLMLLFLLLTAGVVCAWIVNSSVGSNGADSTGGADVSTISDAAADAPNILRDRGSQSEGGYFEEDNVTQSSEQLIINVYRHNEQGGDGRTEQMTVGQYLLGVVAAEMPAKYPEEALKAQAVVARTYIYRKIQESQYSEAIHSGADICDDHRHYQAFNDAAELYQIWGAADYKANYQKIARAVEETADMVVVWQGELIDPLYHASCGGRTENASDVWQGEITYLQSVVCPEAEAEDCEQRYKVTTEQQTFTFAEIDNQLGTELNFAVVQAAAGDESAVAAQEDLLTVTERSPAGKIKSITIGDKQFQAADVRSRLGLKSTNFNWQIRGDRVTLTTVGYGHGVGMCQHGAGLLAEQGYSWQQILKHYYSNIELTARTHTCL